MAGSWCRAHLLPIGLAATILAGLAGACGSDDDGSAAAGDNTGGETVASATTTSGGDPTTGDPTTGDPTTGGPATGDPGTSDSAMDGSGTSEGVPGGSGEGARAPDGVPLITLEVVAEHPHDQTSFTQGLEFHQGLLVESAGLRGESDLRLVEPTTGEVVDRVELDDDLFAEGVTVVDGTALQLTWQEQILLSTPLSDLDLDPSAVTERSNAYEGEGWGLCFDGRELVMSDGSAELHFRDPDTFELLRTVPVTRAGQPVVNLNELECVDGTVWANVWLTTSIVAIDPTTGAVTGVVDATTLVPPGYEGNGNAVLNGIAHHPDTGRFWLTGKLWPVIYEVELTAP